MTGYIHHVVESMDTVSLLNRVLFPCAGNGGRGEPSSGSERSQPRVEFGVQTANHTEGLSHAAGRRLAQR